MASRIAVFHVGQAEMHVRLDDRDVWQCPRIDDCLPDGPFYSANVPPLKSTP